MLGLFKSDYPTDWVEEDPVRLTETVKRKRYEIKLESGDDIAVEADHVRKNYGNRYFHDIEGFEVKTPYSSPKLRKIKGDEKLELNEDEIAAIKKETVSTRKYIAKDVKYATREVKRRVRHSHASRTETEAKILEQPEIIRQNDTE